MVRITIDYDDGDTVEDVYKAIGAFVTRIIHDEARDAYEHAYAEGHKDGMTEAVTTITE